MKEEDLDKNEEIIIKKILQLIEKIKLNNINEKPKHLLKIKN